MPCVVIVCNLVHHDAICCYDANELVEIEQGIQIVIMRLQHWTLGQENIIIHVLYVRHAGT